MIGLQVTEQNSPFEFLLNPFPRTRDLLWKQPWPWLCTVHLSAVACSQPASPRGPLCEDNLSASWTFPSVSCLLRCSLAVEWLQSNLFFNEFTFWFSLTLQCCALQSVVLRERVMQNKGKQARRFPSFKHLIVHVLIIFCTDIKQVINLFLYLFFFHLDCIYVKCIYNREGEKPWGTKPKRISEV